MPSLASLPAGSHVVNQQNHLLGFVVVLDGDDYEVLTPDGRWSALSPESRLCTGPITAGCCDICHVDLRARRTA